MPRDYTAFIIEYYKRSGQYEWSSKRCKLFFYIPTYVLNLFRVMIVQLLSALFCWPRHGKLDDDLQGYRRFSRALVQSARLLTCKSFCEKKLYLFIVDVLSCFLTFYSCYPHSIFSLFLKLYKYGEFRSNVQGAKELYVVRGALACILFAHIHNTWKYCIFVLILWTLRVQLYIFINTYVVG